jgi:hypothetical protein
MAPQHPDHTPPGPPHITALIPAYNEAGRTATPVDQDHGRVAQFFEQRLLGSGWKTRER